MISNSAAGASGSSYFKPAGKSFHALKAVRAPLLPLALGQLLKALLEDAGVIPFVSISGQLLDRRHGVCSLLLAVW
jgi:hypothetical protein